MAIFVSQVVAKSQIHKIFKPQNLTDFLRFGPIFFSCEVNLWFWKYTQSFKVKQQSRRWGNHSILVKSVSTRWALLSTKNYLKISSFWPETPGFDSKIFGTESQRACNELPSTSVLRTVKLPQEYNSWTNVNIL